METCSVVLTFESVDEILWCDHSNETSSAVLFHGTINVSIFYKIKFRIFLKFCSLAALRVKGVTFGLIKCFSIACGKTKTKEVT